MQKEINQTWFFRQEPREVWGYLTKPELIEQWLTKTDFQLRVGHQFGWIKPSGSSTVCEVLEIIPNQLLSYSWKVKDPNGKITIDSRVLWKLFPKNGGTELQLQHSGFNLLEDLDAHDKGWSTCLKRIEELLKETNNANT